MALAAQALEAQKARKPLEQGGALERVTARIERVMGLTFEFSGVAKAQLLRSPLERIVMPHCTWRALQVEKIAQGEPLLFLWVKP